MIGMNIMLLSVPIFSELQILMKEAKKESFTKEEVSDMFSKAVVNAAKNMDEIKKKEDDRTEKEKSRSIDSDVNCEGNFHPKSELQS